VVKAGINPCTQIVENPDHDDPTQGSLSRRFALATLLTAGTALIPGRQQIYHYSTKRIDDPGE